ncbi:MAG: (2E,6E)-farnesyl diphosphate synthase [Idiomarina sp.]|nr:(2E,6E)-farnesyl diphosphate synthase [Idiomarina sp.]
MLEYSMQQFRERHDVFLAQYLDQSGPATRLHEAMQYSALLGGKRVRPFLVYAVGDMLGAALPDLDAPAVAVECIHAYSLIHDDLPAMDDDALRRGHPTCHIRFDEATAILAGDALQTAAFELLAKHPFVHVTPERQLNMIQSLAHASGSQGMCGGQALDIAATGQSISLAKLEQIHQLKTGALIRAAVRLGALTAPKSDQATQASLDIWADAIGLAFQVQDDILDVTSDTATLGKSQGSDQALEKSTYPQHLGLDGARQHLAELREKALQALSGITYNTQLLADFTNYLATRDR